MHDQSADSGVSGRDPGPCSPGRPGLPHPRRWAVWELPTATRALVVAVTTLAAVAAAWAVVATRWHGHEVAAFALLLGAAAVSVEASRRVAEPAGMNANDMLGAWLVPIALLPPVYSLLAPAALMALTQWRVRRINLYKRVFSAAAIGVAHATGSVLFHSLPDRFTDFGQLTRNPLRVTAAVLVIAVLPKALNSGLIGLAVKTADPETSWREVFIVDHGQLELTEVCAGVLIALVVAFSPLLVLLGLAPVLLLQRGMLYAQLHAAARTDAKTGLLNPVTWEREVAAQLAAGRRTGQPAAVLLLDIDHFKRVNDTYGHLVGDDVLRGVADVLRAQVRDSNDLACRFGGEEFAVFLPGVDPAEAPHAAERLRRAVAECAPPVGGALVQVTVSVGIAVADPVATPNANVTELLATADRGLYQAKSEGRDQVRLLTRPDRRNR